MQTLLAILLYMQVIHSPGTYPVEHINNLEIIHAIEIDNIKNDPGLMRIIEEQYFEPATSIWITWPDLSCNAPLIVNSFSFE